jgi:hypothetical protein
MSRVNRHRPKGAAIVNTEADSCLAAARSIHIRVVLRMINQLAKTGKPEWPKGSWRSKM